MSEWTERDQGRVETHLWNSDLPRSHVERALACVRLCAGHADLSKCEVVDKDELGHLRSLTHAMECQVADRLRADLCTEQRRYEDMHQVAYRAIQALKKLSFAAQTTGGVAGPDAGLQEAIQEAGHVMSMAGVSEAVDAASEVITLRTELATLRAELTHANQVIAQGAGQIATLREQLAAREVEIFHLGERNSHLHDELARVCAGIENRQPLFCAKTEIRQPDEARQDGGHG